MFDQLSLDGTVTDNVPARCFPLNLILGGGLPVGHMHEIWGREGTGKTTLSDEFMSLAVHHKGMRGIKYDMEGSSDARRLAKFALYPEGPNQNMDLDQTQISIESVFLDLKKRVAELDKAKSDQKLFVVIDSLGASPPQAHVDAKDLSGLKIGADALAWKNMLRLYNRLMRHRVTMLILNHETQVINTGPFGGRGPKYTSPGGHAPKHHAYIRARISYAGKIKNTDGDIIGVEAVIRTNKNKQAGPFQEVYIPIYFGNPSLAPEEDYVGSWDALACLMYLKKATLIKTSGAKSTLTLYDANDNYFEVNWIGQDAWVSDVYQPYTEDVHRTIQWFHYQAGYQNQAIRQIKAPPQLPEAQPEETS